MKQSITLLLMAILAFGINGCKKEKSNNITDIGQTITPAFIAPSQPGIIQVSAAQLQLHTTTSINVTATLYNSDGTLFSSQPVFLWSSSNTQVATVTAGTIQAIAIGNATISVTDGSHGVAYITVQVVDASTSLSTSPISIVFNQPVITMDSNSTVNFSYTIKNSQGQNVTAIPTFVLSDANSGISISGNTITAGNNKGMFTIKALVNDSLLQGLLVIHIKSYSSTDTSWRLARIELASFPGIFWEFGKASDPVRISVYEQRNAPPNSFGFIGSRVTQTSPEELIIHYPDVIAGNGSGTLTSIASGSTNIKAQYKAFSVSWDAGVAYPLAGNWSGTYQGHSYNFCILQEKSGILYNESTAICETNQSGSIIYTHDLCTFYDHVQGIAMNDIIDAATHFAIDTCSGLIDIYHYNVNQLNLGLVSGDAGKENFANWVPNVLMGLSNTNCIPTCSNWAFSVAPMDNDHLFCYPCFDGWTGQNPKFELIRGSGNCTPSSSSSGTFTFNGNSYTGALTVCNFFNTSSNENTTVCRTDTSLTSITNVSAIVISNPPITDGTFNLADGYFNSCPTCLTVSLLIHNGPDVIMGTKPQAFFWSKSGTVTKSGGTITVSASVYSPEHDSITYGPAPVYPVTATIHCQ